VELAVQFQDRDQVLEHQTVLSTIPDLVELQVQKTSVAFLKQQENVLLPQVKQSYQQWAVQSYNSLSLQETVAGVPREEHLTAFKETDVKQLIWTRNKRFSNKRAADTQESYSDSEIGIKYEKWWPTMV